MCASAPDHPDRGAHPPLDPPRTFGLPALILCFLSAAALGITYSFGIFIGYLEADFSWSREAISGIFSLHLGLLVLSFGLTRRACARYGARPLLPIVGLAGGAGLLAGAHADALWQFFLAYGVLFALGVGAASGVTISAIARRTTDERRPALEAAGIGITVGILIATLVISRLAWNYGWRDALTILAFILWAIAMPSALLLRNIPMAPIPAETASGAGWHARSRNAWLLPLACLTYAFAMHLVISHTVIRAEGMELSALRSGALLTVMAAAALPSHMLAAWLIRTIGQGTTGIAFTLLQAAAIFWFVDPDGTRSYFLFAAIYGVALGGMSRFATDALAEPRFRHLIAPLALAWSIGSALGPWAGGRIVDRTEGYEFAFFCAGIGAMIAAVSIWGMKNERPAVEEAAGPPAGTEPSRSEHAGDILNDAHGEEEHHTGEHEPQSQHNKSRPGQR